MTTAQKVQRDLVKELLSNANLKVEDVEIQDIDQVYMDLKNLGIGNAEQVKKAEIATAQRATIHRLNSTKEQLRELASNPKFNKTITFAKLCKVLEKYDLFIGKASDYVKEIPLKNAKEIVEYCKTRRSEYTYSQMGVVPISTLLKEQRDPAYNRTANNLFICGSLDNFRDSKDRHTIGREVIYNPALTVPGFKLQVSEPNPDPIVVNLILTGNRSVDAIGVFDIVTAWDREAADPEIFNEQQN